MVKFGNAFYQLISCMF